MPSVVLDTNIIISAHLNLTGLERNIFDVAVFGKLRWFTSQEILREYEQVLSRPKFRIETSLCHASLRQIYSSAVMVHPKVKVHAASDPSDNIFLECAQEAHADYLVTGNKRDFPAVWHGTRIVNSRELVEILIPALKK